MDGEAQVTTTESTPAPAPEAPVTETQETPQTEQPSNGEGKPEGFDPVDVRTATPEQIEARINRLYGNVKKNEKDAREARQANEILIARFQELANNQQQIVTHLQSTDYVEAENTLRQQQRTAWDKGDLETYHAATEKLVEVKAQKAVAARDARQQKPNENRPQMVSRAVSATDAVNMAVQNGEINDSEANIYRAWAGETDPYGNPKRPWVNETDIRNSTAAYEGAAVFNNPAFANKTFVEKLREVDRRMGLQTQTQQGSNVLPAGNLTGQRKTSNVKLSQMEETIAVKTKFGGSKAKSDEDHKTAYLQAKIKHSSDKRSRA